METGRVARWGGAKIEVGRGEPATGGGWTWGTLAGAAVPALISLVEYICEDGRASAFWNLLMWKGLEAIPIMRHSWRNSSSSSSFNCDTSSAPVYAGQRVTIAVFVAHNLGPTDPVRAAMNFAPPQNRSATSAVGQLKIYDGLGGATAFNNDRPTSHYHSHPTPC